MNLSRSSIWLHSFQGTFALLAKGPVCNPCLRNELSPISQEGQRRQRTTSWPHTDLWAGAIRANIAASICFLRTTEVGNFVECLAARCEDRVVLGMRACCAARHSHHPRRHRPRAKQSVD